MWNDDSDVSLSRNHYRLGHMHVHLLQAAQPRTRHLPDFSGKSCLMSVVVKNKDS